MDGLVIAAGVILILWHAHKEFPGLITMVIVFCTIVVGPLGLWGYVLSEVNVYVGVAGFIVHLILLIAAMAYPRDKILRKDAEEQSEVWREVEAMPLPDQATIGSWKRALNPGNILRRGVTDEEAINAWKRAQFNILYKKKHPFTTYFFS